MISRCSEAEKTNILQLQLLWNFARIYLTVDTYAVNYHTSVELVYNLLNGQIYFVGTLGNNCKEIPRDIIQKNLKKGGEIISKVT